MSSPNRLEASHEPENTGPAFPQSAGSVFDMPAQDTGALLDGLLPRQGRLDLPARQVYGRRRHPSEPVTDPGRSSGVGGGGAAAFARSWERPCPRHADFRQIAAETLGRRRRVVRRELRDLSGLVRAPERVFTMARGWWDLQGGLVVATDRRLLLLSRPLLRRARVRELPFARLARVGKREHGDQVRLELTTADESIWLEVAPASRGAELAELVARRSAVGHVHDLPEPILRPSE
jgi:hypothetical protein